MSGGVGQEEVRKNFAEVVGQVLGIGVASWMLARRDWLRRASLLRSRPTPKGMLWSGVRPSSEAASFYRRDRLSDGPVWGLITGADRPSGIGRMCSSVLVNPGKSRSDYVVVRETRGVLVRTTVMPRKTFRWILVISIRHVPNWLDSGSADPAAP